MLRLLKTQLLYLVVFLVLVFFSIIVLFPNNIQINAFGQEWKIGQIIPEYIYFWGRKIKVQPQFHFSLDYQLGEFISFEVDKHLSTDQIEQLSVDLSSRVKQFYQFPINLHYVDDQQPNLLIIETLPLAEQEAIEVLVTQPGKLKFSVQNNDISQEEMIVVDDWLNNFEELSITEENVKNAKEQLDFQSSQPMVLLELDNQGRQVLFRAMRNNAQKMLMIMVDDQVVLLSPIEEPIHNGRISIFGGGSLWQAQLFASVLAHPQNLINITIPEAEISQDFSELRRLETKTFLGKEISLLIYHISILSVILLTGIVLIILRYKKIGLILAQFFVVSFLFTFAWIRLTGFLISYQLFVAFCVISIWSLLMVTFFLNEVFYLKQTAYDDLSTIVLKVFSLKRKIVRRIIFVPILSFMCLSFLNSLSFTSKYFSDEFVSSLWPFYLISLVVGFFAVVSFSKKE